MLPLTPVAKLYINIMAGDSNRSMGRQQHFNGTKGSSPLPKPLFPHCYCVQNIGYMYSETQVLHLLTVYTSIFPLMQPPPILMQVEGL